MIHWEAPEVRHFFRTVIGWAVIVSLAGVGVSWLASGDLTILGQSVPSMRGIDIWQGRTAAISFAIAAVGLLGMLVKPSALHPKLAALVMVVAGLVAAGPAVHFIQSVLLTSDHATVTSVSDQSELARSLSDMVAKSMRIAIREGAFVTAGLGVVLVLLGTLQAAGARIPTASAEGDHASIIESKP